FADLITFVKYDVWSNPTRMNFGNGAYQTSSYNALRGWPMEIDGFDTAAGKVLHTGYTRTATGRISGYDTMFTSNGVTSDQAGSFNYAYDYAGRLLSAANSRGQAAYSQVFSYDRAGR